jgi:hypothetical protein
MIVRKTWFFSGSLLEERCAQRTVTCELVAGSMIGPNLKLGDKRQLVFVERYKQFWQEGRQMECFG